MLSVRIVASTTPAIVLQRYAIGKQILCVILAWCFKVKILQELLQEEGTLEYIQRFRNILDLCSNFEEEAHKIKQAQMLVSCEGMTWSDASKQVGASVIRDANWVVKGKRI